MYWKKIVNNFILIKISWTRKETDKKIIQNSYYELVKHIIMIIYACRLTTPPRRLSGFSASSGSFPIAGASPGTFALVLNEKFTEWLI